MRCANKAATDANARMRAAGEQASQDSAAGAPRLLLLICSLQHLMLQVHVVIHVKLLHLQPLMRVVVSWTSIPK